MKVIFVVLAAVVLLAGFVVNQMGLLAPIKLESFDLNQMSIAYVPFVGNFGDAWKIRDAQLGELEELYEKDQLGPYFGIYYDPPGPNARCIIGRLLLNKAEPKPTKNCRFGFIEKQDCVSIEYPYHPPLYLLGSAIKVYPVLDKALEGKPSKSGILEIYDYPKGKVQFIQGYGKSDGLLSNFPE